MLPGSACGQRLLLLAKAGIRHKDVIFMLDLGDHSLPL